MIVILTASEPSASPSVSPISNGSGPPVTPTVSLTVRAASSATAWTETERVSETVAESCPSVVVAETVRLKDPEKLGGGVMVRPVS